MRTCFVPFCDVKNKDQPNRTMFLVPKERKLFAQWYDALPKVRELKSTDKVCYLHFKPDEILNTFDHFINGQIIKIKRDRPRLKPNAIPCLEMTTREEWLLHRAKSRLSNHYKNLKISDNTENKFKLNLNIEGSQQECNPLNIYIEVENGEEEHDINDMLDAEDHEQSTTAKFGSEIEDLLAKENMNTAIRTQSPINNINSADSTLAELTNLFDFLYENVYGVLMPNTLWGIHRCPQRSFICFSYVDAFKMQIIKMLVIKNDGSMQLFISGSVKILHLLQDIDSLESLSIFLNKLDVGHLCFGKSTNLNCDLIVEPDADNCWLTDDNEQVFLCKFCLPQN